MRSLPRLKTLSLQCNESLIPEMLTALRAGPAPILTGFEFSYPHDDSRLHEGFVSHDGSGSHDESEPDDEPSSRDEPSPHDQDSPNESTCAPAVPVLPLDLFAGSAPQLQTVCMDACRFPASPVPALVNVRVLIQTLDSGDDCADSEVDLLREHHRERVFVSCPALEELSITCRCCDLTKASWAACPPTAVTRLRRLIVVANCCDSTKSMEVVVRTFAHIAMENIEVATFDVNFATLSLMLGHLDNSPTLELDIRCTYRHAFLPPTLRLSIFDEAHARRRTLTHDSKDVLDDFDEVVTCFTRVAHRITGISLPASKYAWNFLIALFQEARLASVDTLRVTLEEGALSQLKLDGPLVLPALARIELNTGDSGHVEVASHEVLYLVRTILCVPEGQKLALKMTNVHLRGDIDFLCYTPLS
ncbi:hypothetical protein AURDEDRAFT_176318 [Auricularia subglabra TFB-10046 SS5]|nr:hypothetical protein AURDEDRAFT_176318 [Auricularia subglabra TFB-10046 SS5]